MCQMSNRTIGLFLCSCKLLICWDCARTIFSKSVRFISKCLVFWPFVPTRLQEPLMHHYSPEYDPFVPSFLQVNKHLSYQYQELCLRFVLPLPISYRLSDNLCLKKYRQPNERCQETDSENFTDKAFLSAYIVHPCSISILPD